VRSEEGREKRRREEGGVKSQESGGATFTLNSSPIRVTVYTKSNTSRNWNPPPIPFKREPTPCPSQEGIYGSIFV
jgi:hypothetical protein